MERKWEDPLLSPQSRFFPSLGQTRDGLRVQTPSNTSEGVSRRTGCKALLFSPVWVTVFALFAFVSSGCGSSTDRGGGLSEAFCDDLAAGYTPLQILRQSVEDGTYSPRTAADRAYGFAAASCPAELKSNEALRVYLENWNIDPDA